MTLYTQVTSNRWKTALYLAFYGLIFLAVGWVIAAYEGNISILFIAGVIAIVQGFVSFYYSDKIALLAAKAHPLDEVKYKRIYQLVQNLVITAGLPMPRLYLIEDTALNAFATGRSPKHSAIAVTVGLIEGLDDNEISGVLAHELTHIGNEDIRLMSMVMVMAGMIALISDIFMRQLFWGRRRSSEDSGAGSALVIIALAMVILAPIVATMIQLAISRKREFMADAGGVLLTRYPEGLIGALKKIGGDTEPLEVANRASAHMYFSNPLRAQWLAGLFSTHPPIEDRITALEKGSGMV